MTQSDTKKQLDRKRSPSRGEIVTGVIGLTGIVITALFSNWDKMFPRENVVASTYSGYQPTGDPQVELRYFTEITGMRGMLRGMQAQLLDHYKAQLAADGEADSALMTKLWKIAEEEIDGQYDKVMNVYIPVASKYFSLAEIQELNKFYSTPVMRELVRKQPLMLKEYMPAAMAALQKDQERFTRRLQEEVQQYIDDNSELTLTPPPPPPPPPSSVGSAALIKGDTAP
jgi:hypothetical protein